MAGGLMQLVAYGAQDIYLTGNPQITLFKVVYRRHTNFSMESIIQSFNGQADFGKKVSCTISRNGDLISKMYLEVTLPEWNTQTLTGTNGWCDYIGHALIKNIDIEIGGQMIDRQYGEWLHIWNELTQCEGKKYGYKQMIGSQIQSIGKDEADFTGLYNFIEKNIQENDPNYDNNSNNYLYNIIDTTIPGLYNWCKDLYDDNLLLRESSSVILNGKNITDWYNLMNNIWLEYDNLRTTFKNEIITQVSNKCYNSIINFNTNFENLINKILFQNNQQDQIYKSIYNVILYFKQIAYQTNDIEGLNINFNEYEDMNDTYLDFNDNLLPVIYDGYKVLYNNYLLEIENNKYNQISKTTLYIPLQFWFNNNPGLALPLISLQYHEVKLNIEFNEVQNCVTFEEKNSSIPSLENVDLYIDYIYLDTDERRRFAQSSHEYLITQLQFTGDETISSNSLSSLLSLNHPCKELIWVCRSSDAETYNNWFNFTTNGTQSIESITDTEINPIINASILLNGHERFSQRDGKYFNYVQPYQHHTNIPFEGINVYSFALKPEEHQPSGTCNFSRIDSANLRLSISNNFTGVCKIYAVNYNILRIMSGMGGLAFSN